MAAKRSDPGIPVAATPLQLSWLFSSLSCMRQDRLITCSLELELVGGSRGSKLGVSIFVSINSESLAFWG